MNLASSYARALFELTLRDVSRGREYLKGLEGALVRRGHERLLPAIFTEYQKLHLKEERSHKHATVTPEKERTRTLLELYRTLIETH